MENMYDWVPWFGELAKRVAEMNGSDLVRRASRVRWKPDGSSSPLTALGDDHIDPFSFFYTLATYCSGRERREEVCQSVNEAFDLEEPTAVDSDEAFIFPRGVPLNTLFHEDGTGDPPSLWQLFRSAVEGTEAVDPENFRRVLEIKNVATPKLTQTLFLINAGVFFPFDKGTRKLLANPAAKLGDWQSYLAAIGHHPSGSCSGNTPEDRPRRYGRSASRADETAISANAALLAPACPPAASKGHSGHVAVSHAGGLRPPVSQPPDRGHA